MKNLFTNITVFVVLSFVLSSFVACTKTTNSPNDSADSGTVLNANSDGATTAKGSEFPPAPSAIMQAEIKDVDGNTFKLEDKKGKVVFVNLWATWCGPCRSEMPAFVALQDKYKDNDFEIIGLDVDPESPEDVKAFAQTMKLNYQLGYADSKLMSEFLKSSKTGNIPQSFLIDREGKLRNVFIGAGIANLDKIKETVEKTVNE